MSQKIMSTNQFLCLKKVHEKFLSLSMAPCRSQSLVWLRKNQKVEVWTLFAALVFYLLVIRSSWP